MILYLNFREWLGLDLLGEISKLSHLRTSGIDLSPRWSDNYPEDEDGSLEYKFSHNGNEYSVTMNKDVDGEHAIVPGIGVSKDLNVWDVAFTGPQIYKLTRSNASDAVSVYSKVLAALKRLLETREVDIISFSAYEPEMVPMYDRFFNQYLKGDFAMLRGGETKTYIRKDKLADMMTRMTPEQRKVLESEMSGEQEKHEQEVSGVRAIKPIMRRAYAARQSIVGKVTGLRSWHDNNVVLPAVVREIKPNYIKLLVLWRGNLRNEFMITEYTVTIEEYHELEDPQVISPALQRALESGADKISKIVPSFRIQGSKLSVDQFHRFEKVQIPQHVPSALGV